MRATAFGFLLLAGTLFSCDNKDDNDIKLDDVPATVSETLMTNFPNARDIEWEKNGEDFEADFDVNNVDYSAFINATGNMLKHKYDITENELPEAVRTAVSQNYADYKIDDPEVLVQNGDTLYQVDLDHITSTDQKLVYAADGQVVEQAYWD